MRPKEGGNDEEMLLRSASGDSESSRIWGNNKVSYHPIEISKVFLLLVGAFVLSFIAFSDRSATKTFGISSAVSQMISLDELPPGIRLGSFAEPDQQHLFGLFSKKYGKSYQTSEYQERFSKFSTSLHAADARNDAESARGRSKDGARHGITKFSDLSVEEFRKAKLGAQPSLKSSSSTKTSSSKTLTDSEQQDELPYGTPLTETLSDYTGSATASDWTQGTSVYTTAVQDQGYCGSCWCDLTLAFSIRYLSFVMIFLFIFISVCPFL